MDCMGSILWNVWDQYGGMYGINIGLYEINNVDCMGSILWTVCDQYRGKVFDSNNCFINSPFLKRNKIFKKIHFQRKNMISLLFFSIQTV